MITAANVKFSSLSLQSFIRPYSRFHPSVADDISQDQSLYNLDIFKLHTWKHPIQS